MKFYSRKAWVAVFVSLLTFTAAFGIGPDDEEFPAEAAPVARIKFLEGKALVKRVDSDDWESAVPNLPLVEGDELKTDALSKVEIQLSNEAYVRLGENAFVKFVSLGYEGTALSLAEGSMILSVMKFEQSDGFLEVDAPQTTLAVTKSGNYRIDAGSETDRSVRVTVGNGGTARLYTLDSGFTLKNEQTAFVSLDGPYAGKWSISRNNGISDELADWSADRDLLINKSLRDAHYGQYYDDDMYGADDLSYHGSWQYVSSYGYVWSPYSRSISRYSNWSPYRYGEWRWLPYYGWTWVNDEPWGWATYHYGRWIYVRGRWYWTPYSYSSYYPRRRSWWRPALVYIDYIGNNICWYPLPYNYSYYDYNRRYRRYWRNNRRRNRNNSDQRTRRQTQPDPKNVARGNRLRTPPLNRVPSTGVISVRKQDFGFGKTKYRTADPTISRKILAKRPVVADSPPLIPSRKEIIGVKTPDIIATPTSKKATSRGAKIGATNRVPGTALDKQLRTKRIRANRPVLTNSPDIVSKPGTARKPATGVFDRRKKPPAKTVRPAVKSPDIVVAPTPKRRTPPPTKKSSPPVYKPRSTQRKSEQKPPPVNRSQPRRSEPKRSSPPVRRSQPRRTETRKPSPPVRRSQPRRTETRKPSPPVKRSAPKKSSPPPKKAAPSKRPPSRTKKPATKSDS